MNTKNRTFLIFVTILYVLYHIITLKYSPIPWFDEVVFADITPTFAKTGKFLEDSRSISPITAQVNKAYGPVYFMIQALVTNIFGMTIFSFRMTNLTFGLANLFLVYKICKSLKFNTQSIVFTILLIAFDPQFNQFLHSGRMDFVGLFFYLCAYLAFINIKQYQNKNYLLKSVLTGFLLACAFLTNPRIMFGFGFFIFYFIYEIAVDKYKNRKPILFKNMVVLAVFVFIYGIWIFHQFGSVSNYISETYTKSPLLQQHIGLADSSFKFTYNFVIHAISILCVLMLVVNKKLTNNAQLLLFALSGIVCFLIIVNGGFHGRYFGLIVPFTMILIVGTTVNVYNNIYSKFLAGGILSIFIAAFLFKGAYLVASKDQRNPDTYDKIISSHIPDGASVAGDFQYYYMSRNHNWKYQCLSENGRQAEQEKYFKREKYEYFILNKRTEYQEFFKNIVMGDDYTLIAKIEYKGEKTFLHQLVSKLPYRIYSGYEGEIYKRIEP